MADWKTIHTNFRKKDQRNNNKTYQQLWEEKEIIYEEAKEWIEMGFEPEGLREVENWKSNKFDFQQTKKWINAGVKVNEVEFADYLRTKGHDTHQLSVDLQKLRKEYHNVQNYLDWKYPLEKRGKVDKIEISTTYQEFKGKLVVIENFPKLEYIRFYNVVIASLRLNCLAKLDRLVIHDNCKLKDLTIDDCPKLKRLDVKGYLLSNIFINVNSYSEISSLSIANSSITDFYFAGLVPEKLDSLVINGNKFASQDLSFLSPFVNLTYLCLGMHWDINEGGIRPNYHFYGSLEPLKSMIKLDTLDISMTNIDSGLEWLPESLKKIYCTIDEASLWEYDDEEKLGCFKIMEELKDFYCEEDKSINHCYYDFQAWRNSRLKSELTNKEDRIRELIDLIKRQKEKIINTFLRLFPERELLQKLITLHLELTKFKKQSSDAVDYGRRCREYGKQCEKIKDQLWDKLENDTMNKIELILSDCEELVSWELELDFKLKEQPLFLEEKKQALQITADGDNCLQPQSHEELKHQQSTLISSPTHARFVEFIEEARKNQKSIIQQIQQLCQITISGIKEDEMEKLSIKKPILEQLIGKGGYGEVYRGKWGLQEVAIKKLYLLPIGNSEENIREIRNEINILKNLRNKHIIQYYGIYLDGQELLIVMDYAENGTLAQFISNIKDHDWKFNTDLISQIVRGLDYIHQKGIIHRDLKSWNILLTNGCQVKISDFGLSKIKNISSFRSKNAVGSLRWMAPEALKDKKYSEQSDIYSLGMIIWEVAAKYTIPFKNIDDNLVGFHIINNEKEEIPSDTPRNVHDIIEQCWKNDPNKRATLAKILEMIEDTKLFSDTICIGRLLDYKSISESQSSQEITDFIHSHSNQSNLAINFSSRESVKSTKRRKLSISSRIEISRGENISKVIEVSEYQSELKKTDTEKQLLQTRTSSIRSAEEIDQLNFSKEQTEQQLQAQIQIPPKQN